MLPLGAWFTAGRRVRVQGARTSTACVPAGRAQPVAWRPSSPQQPPPTHNTRAGKWGAAHRRRGDLLGFIARAAGAATLLDVRRYEEYDADKMVDRFLNQANVKVALLGWGGVVLSGVLG